MWKSFHLIRKIKSAPHLNFGGHPRGSSIMDDRELPMISGGRAKSYLQHPCSRPYLYVTHEIYNHIRITCKILPFLINFCNFLSHILILFCNYLIYLQLWTFFFFVHFFRRILQLYINIALNHYTREVLLHSHCYKFLTQLIFTN